MPTKMSLSRTIGVQHTPTAGDPFDKKAMPEAGKEEYQAAIR